MIVVVFLTLKIIRLGIGVLKNVFVCLNCLNKMRKKPHKVIAGGLRLINSALLC